MVQFKKGWTIMCYFVRFTAFRLPVIEQTYTLDFCNKSRKTDYISWSQLT
jgi:hypothetical protein